MSDPRGHHSSFVVSLVILLLVAGFLPAGCSADFSLSCGEDQTGTTTYTDSRYGYSFQYPGDWVVQEGDAAEITEGNSSNGGMSVYDPDGTVVGDYCIDLFQVSVYELNLTVDESMMPEIRNQVDDMLKGLETQTGDWTRVDDLSEVTVGGARGYKTTYDFTTETTPTTSTFYFLFVGDIQYQLTLQAATDAWDERQSDFEAILASFQPRPEQ